MKKIIVNHFIFINNKVYNKYTDVNCNENKEKKEESCLSVIINKEEELIELIGSCSDGNIRIWNFHSGELLLK